MRKNIILAFLLLTGITGLAQDRDRFNIGIHYRPPVGNEVTEFAGGADLRVRAISLGIVNLGAGLSATYRSSQSESFSNYVMLNPHVYVEVQPFPFALKPYLHLGYVAYSQKLEMYQDIFPAPDAYDPAFYNDDQAKIKYSGFTAAAGVRFDFAKVLYADLGLTYLNIQADSPGFTTFRNDGYGMINLGFGFRF